MNNSQWRHFRIQLENIVIALLAIFSLFLFLLTFFPFSKMSHAVQISFEMGRMVQRAFSIILFVLSVQLWKRKRNAWVLAMSVFTLNFLRGLIGMGYPLHNKIMFCDLVLFVFFFCLRKDFCCPAGRKNRKRTLLFIILAIAGVLANVGITWHYMRLGFAGGSSVSFADSFSQGVGMIFGMGYLPSSMADHHGTTFVLFWFSWGCILAAILGALRPWIQKQAHGVQEIQHARTLLNLYSQNPCSYLALEDDKSLYFGRSVDGVLPYGTVGNTVVVNGDPVCKDENFPALLAEFKEFCQNSAHNIFFLGLTDYYISEYEKQGFGLVKSGEEARFKLSDYEISGKKGAKMRMNINHARKAGVTVHEYKVLEKRDPAMDREFDRITDEWLEGKKSGMLQFTMGTVGLDNPMDKRYFYALNSDEKMVAFIVFVPFLGKNGYMADVTRHGKDAPSGVMETIIYDAFQVFKEEGVGYGSLGVAPLAGLSADSKNPMERLLQFIYDHLNSCYGFRNLYRAKEKYSPTEWVPSYYAYLPKYPTPGMLYATVEIQNPHGIRGYIMTLLKGEWKRLRK